MRATDGVAQRALSQQGSLSQLVMIGGPVVEKNDIVLCCAADNLHVKDVFFIEWQQGTSGGLITPCASFGLRCNFY